MIVANDNIPSEFAIVGTQRFLPSSHMRRFMAEECMEPVGGYFLRVTGNDRQKYFVAAKVPRDENGHQTGTWCVEWHTTERGAAKAVAPGWKYYETHDYFEDAA